MIIKKVLLNKKSRLKYVVIPRSSDINSDDYVAITKLDEDKILGIDNKQEINEVNIKKDKSVTGKKVQETYLKNALVAFFIENPDKEFSLEDIYFGVQNHTKLNDELKESCKYMPYRLKFQHLIDCHIQTLKKEGFLKHKGRNRWLHNPYE